MEAENNRRNPYIFTSEDRQGVPRDATHVIIDGSVKVIFSSTIVRRGKKKKTTLMIWKVTIVWKVTVTIGAQYNNIFITFI